MYSTPVCAPCDDLDFPATTNNCVPEQNESEIAYMFLSIPSSTSSTNNVAPAVTSESMQRQSPEVIPTKPVRHPIFLYLKKIGGKHQPAYHKKLITKRIVHNKKNDLYHSM